MILAGVKEARTGRPVPMSAEELATKVGCTPQTIHRIERGVSCSKNTAKRVAKALGKKLEEIAAVHKPQGQEA